MFTFSDIESNSSSVALISPRGRVVPWSQRSIVFRQLFKMTPVEFQKEYHAVPDSVFISHGYMYVDGGRIQIESEPTGLNTNQVQRIMNYVNTLHDAAPVEIMLLQHDPQTYQLLSEEPWFQGTVQGLKDKMLSSPSMTHGVGQEFQTPSQYTYVPQKGARPAEKPSRWVRDFSFPTGKTADILSMPESTRDPDAPDSIELLGDHQWWGMPMVHWGSGDMEVAFATDEMADKAVYMDIMDSLFAFNTDFLMRFIKRGISEEAVLSMQQQSESGNAALRSWLKNKKEFVEEAVASDGRGHFLSPYDGSERTLEEYHLRVVDLPSEVLKALKITRSYTDSIYVYTVND